MGVWETHSPIPPFAHSPIRPFSPRQGSRHAAAYPVAMGTYEFVPHTADIALHVTGQDLPDLLRTAALGVMAAALGASDLPPHRPAGAAPRLLESEDAPDVEGLLVNFLNEVIYQAEVRGEVYADFEILSAAPDGGVRAYAYADPDLAATHAVKAATYYDLRVESTPAGLEATVVCDV